MELSIMPVKNDSISASSAFIEANTFETSLQAIKQEHIIPVFVKDNEPAIAHSEFIEAAMEATAQVYFGEMILKPNIRVSHPVKGRIPEAKNKPANELLEHEKTLYYERMAFLIEIPTIQSDIAGNRLNLTIGGVKAHNLDNLSTKSGTDQHFKVFAGFQNKVCTNLCVSSDGYKADLKVKTLEELHAAIVQLLRDYDAVSHTEQLREFQKYELSSQQFAHLVGKCRLYRYLPDEERKDLSVLQFGDAQINALCKDYYADAHFSRKADGNIDLWNLYNLFTGANKSSYIDTFLDRSANATAFVQELKQSIVQKQSNWFLN